MLCSVILYLHIIFFAFAPVVESLFVVALRIKKHKVLLLLFSPLINVIFQMWVAYISGWRYRPLKVIWILLHIKLCNGSNHKFDLDIYETNFDVLIHKFSFDK